MLESLNLMQMVTVALNVIILYLILRKLLFKPVTAFMENRSNGIRNSIDAAEKAKSEALELKRQYEEQLRSARKEAARLVEDARERAEKTYETIIESARKDAEEIVNRAREEIKRERAEMVREVRNQAASLALAAASKVIQANMDTESNRVLVNKFIREEGAA